MSKDPFCNRCGKCCEAFYLPFVQEFLDLPHEDFFKQCSTTDLNFTGGQLQEADQTLLDYLEPLTLDQAKVSGLQISYHDTSDGRDKCWYRCKLFERDQEGLGGCSVHEHRPALCRRYQPQASGEEGSIKNAEGIMHIDCSYLDFFGGGSDHS